MIASVESERPKMILTAVMAVGATALIATGSRKPKIADEMDKPRQSAIAMIFLSSLGISKCQ